jgi:hypothetical protein
MKAWNVAAASAALTLSLITSATAASGSCNRRCLDDMVDAYLAALVAHDPSRVPIAPQAKFVENTVPMKPGDGLWKTASAVPTSFKIYVADPNAEQVGFIGVMQEQGKPIELGLRLKLRNGRIVEMEHLVARNLTPTGLKNLATPRASFSEEVPAAERSTHAQLLKIGASYYDALTQGRGSAAPFAGDCERRENGIQTSTNPPPAPQSDSGKPPSSMAILGSLGCAAQMNTGMFAYITRIEPRRVWIADVQRGLVFGLSQFRQPMRQKLEKIVGVPGVTTLPMNFKPFDLPAAHIFKISGGKIHDIEAMGFVMPYDSKTGWE